MLHFLIKEIGSISNAYARLSSWQRLVANGANRLTVKTTATALTEITVLT